MTIKDICDVLEIGLRAECVDVLEVRLVNNSTFLVDFIAKTKGSVDLKSEIAFAISFLNGFFRDNPNTPESLEYFAAQAFTSEKASLMHAISSIETAEHISNGRSIEWLKNTIFEDHSEEYKQGIAKRLIGELENGLRLLICGILEEAAGNDWWNRCVGTKVRQTTESMFERQEGLCCDKGRTLIYFTFLLDLKKIVVANWKEFKNVFENQTRFSDLLGQLNLIRRAEAHNRSLKDHELKELEAVYAELMGRIAQAEPNAASNYLVDNWRVQLQDIFSADVENQVIVQPDCNIDEALESVKDQVKRYADLETQVSSLIVPPAKRGLHDELLVVIGNVKSSLAEMVDLTMTMNVEGLDAAQARNQKAHDDFKAFTATFLMSEL